jgi:hypothetical protein
MKMFSDPHHTLRMIFIGIMIVGALLMLIGAWFHWYYDWENLT